MACQAAPVVTTVHTAPSVERDPFLEQFISVVTDTIDNLEKIQGIGEVVLLKAEIMACWKQLSSTGVVESTEPDQAVIPVYVALQCIIEYVLTKESGKSVGYVQGLIHTPMPATPLCTEERASARCLDLEVA